MKKVIKFYANWCGPCQVYTPNFKHVTDQLKGWDVEEYDVDNPEGSSAAKFYKVVSIPTTVILIDSEEPRIIKGVLSIEELAQELI